MNKKILYGVGVLCFIAYLFMANDIILLLFDDDVRVTQLSFDHIQSNAEAYAYIDKYENLGGLFEKAYFQGWAFCETLSDNQDKRISIVLKDSSNSNCYMIETQPQIRHDVYGAFKDNKDIWNRMAGLDCQFSTIKMREGIYDLYIYVWENEHSYGLYDSQIQFRKDASGLTRVSE